MCIKNIKCTSYHLTGLLLFFPTFITINSGIMISDKDNTC